MRAVSWNGINLVRGVEEAKGSLEVVCETHVGWAKGWLARVLPCEAHLQSGRPKDTTYAFQQPRSQSLSRAGNGTRTFALTHDGVYVGESVLRSYEAHRTFFRVEGGRITAWTASEDEARAWLGLEGTLAELGTRLREKEAAIAAEGAEKLDLPALTGSEKQVAWAQTLRARVLPAAQRLGLLRAIRQQAEAGFWIARRNDSPEGVCFRALRDWTDVEPEAAGELLGRLCADRAWERIEEAGQLAQSQLKHGAKAGEILVGGALSTGAAQACSLAYRARLLELAAGTDGRVLVEESPT